MIAWSRGAHKWLLTNTFCWCRTTSEDVVKMLVAPRSSLFRYGASPPKEVFDEKNGRRTVRKDSLPRQEKRAPTVAVTRPRSPVRIQSEPVVVKPKAVAVPVPERSSAGGPTSMPTMKSRPVNGNRRKKSMPENHRSDSMPPAVAALLAVTTIPRPRPNQFRRRSSDKRRVSIDELVNEWKTDETLKPSLSSSPSLSVLLEDADELEEQITTGSSSATETEYLHSRSTSSDSIPSLSADDKSVLSLTAPSTPPSLRSRRSNSNLKKKEIPRSLPAGQDCALDHPLVPLPISDTDDDLFLPTPVSRATTPKPRSSFTSNLTTSLQALKSKAISSIFSFASGPPSTPSSRAVVSPLSDEMLWSHPFLFPRFSPEVRPNNEGLPTKAQRRYMNPVPLTFEEQEAPFQQALHAPYLSEANNPHINPDVPTIQMQTYNRGRRKGRSGKQTGALDPNSEAGRALQAAAGVRQREPRENSDFLRVVVLEMNMRREGKIEMGRAKIWLPPRQPSPGLEERRAGRVPSRWVAVSAQ